MKAILSAIFILALPALMVMFVDSAAIKSQKDVPEKLAEVSNEDGGAPIENNCHCAVFATRTPSETDSSILEQSPLTVTCDAIGKEKCLKLCSALAEAAKERGPQILCTTVGHYNQLVASVHSRICDAENWTYTGLTASHEICCHEHKVIDCEDMAADISKTK